MYHLAEIFSNFRGRGLSLKKKIYTWRYMCVYIYIYVNVHLWEKEHKKYESLSKSHSDKDTYIYIYTHNIFIHHHNFLNIQHIVKKKKKKKKRQYSVDCIGLFIHGLYTSWLIKRKKMIQIDEFVIYNDSFRSSFLTIIVFIPMIQPTYTPNFIKCLWQKVRNSHY